MDALKSLFCETEAQIGSSIGVSQAGNNTFPFDIFLSPEMTKEFGIEFTEGASLFGAGVPNAPKRSLPLVSGGDWRDLWKARGVTFFAFADTSPGFKHNAILIPHRAAVDVSIGEALVSGGVIEPGLRLAALGTDFANPMFSIKRCGLVTALESVPLAKGDPQKVTADVRAAIAATSLPGKAEFLELLDSMAGDKLETGRKALGERIRAYGVGCRSPNSVTKDVSKLAKLFEARQQRMASGDDGVFKHPGRFAIESFSSEMFYPATTGLAAEARAALLRSGLDEHCELIEQPAFKP
jgi:hypothetical protein